MIYHVKTPRIFMSYWQKLVQVCFFLLLNSINRGVSYEFFLLLTCSYNFSNGKYNILLLAGTYGEVYKVMT